jgi:hypothetical protein
VQVITSRDLEALLGFERQRQLLGCTETSCMTEIASAFGVDYLLITELSVVEDVWLLSFSLLHLGQGKSVGRSTDQLSSHAEVLGAAGRRIPELLGAALGGAPAGVGVVSSGAPTTPTSGAMRITALALAGAGAATLAGGIYFDVMAARASAEVSRAYNGGAWSAALRDVETGGRRNSLVGALLTSAGAAVIAAGALLFGLDLRWRKAATVSASLQPGGRSRDGCPGFDPEGLRLVPDRLAWSSLLLIWLAGLSSPVFLIQSTRPDV